MIELWELDEGLCDVRERDQCKGAYRFLTSAIEWMDEPSAEMVTIAWAGMKLKKESSALYAFFVMLDC